MSNAPSKPVSFSRPKVGYFSNRPRTYIHTYMHACMYTLHTYIHTRARAFGGHRVEFRHTQNKTYVTVCEMELYLSNRNSGKGDVSTCRTFSK